MTTPLLRCVLGSTLCAIPFGLPAQEDAAKPQPPDPNVVLKQGLLRMATVNRVTFHTTEEQDSAMSRRLARQVGQALGAGAVDVRGSWSDGILHAKMNEDADEMLSYRGRMVARNDAVSWKLRRDRLATGAAMPFVLDPGRFFEAMLALPASALQVKHHEASTYKDKAVMIIGLTFEAEDARDFALSGSLPAVSSGGMGMMIRLGGGGGGGAATLPDLTVDVALYVEPATGYVHKIKCRCYQVSQGGGNFQVRVQGGGGLGGNDAKEEAEEEEVKEKDKDGKRIYKRGLPVRAMKDDLSRLDFDVILTKHAQAQQLKLDPQAKKLLRISE